MHDINRPSNGIRELAAGMEDVLFGRGGYQWFLERNALDFVINQRRAQAIAKRSRIAGSVPASMGTQAGANLSQDITTGEGPKQTQARSRVPKRSNRKRMESTPTNEGDKNQLSIIEDDEMLCIDYKNCHGKEYVGEGDFSDGGEVGGASRVCRDEETSEIEEFDEIEPWKIEAEEKGTPSPNINIHARIDSLKTSH
ncbi:unnamed protein product [Rhizoctonia solani]|uniref:Uncharacterized protein n=1 Tax=Rhizoctonia solani TaxID=456999 RepID=A0A8H2WMF8_9AGAM|nr:unnamed protein product [Rhizoctonia solani]